MEDFPALLVVAFIEFMGWLVLLALWCFFMMLVAIGRFGIGAVRAGHHAVMQRREYQRQLTFISDEYEAAVEDIRRISASTRRRIRALSGERP